MDPDAPITDDEIRALFTPLVDTSLAIAVSGGADSMALMHIARRALELAAPGASPLAPPARPRLIVLTVDHGLRAGSAEDAAWVVSQAQAAGLPCRLLRWEGEKPTHGIQAAAREARYRLMQAALFEEALAHDELQRILLTAHHLEDQAETFLMRLARGSGIDGLSAMQRVAVISTSGGTDRGDGAQLTIHRPILNMPKSRLVATLRAAGMEWREDPSNEREDFERVRVRKALSSLADLGIRGDAIARSAMRLSRARLAIQAQAIETAERCVDWHIGQFGSIALDTLIELPEEIAMRILMQMMAAYGGDTPEPRLSEVEALAERIRTISDRAWPARAATLGGCRLDWRPGGALRVWREAGRAGLPEIGISPGAGATMWDRRFEITAASRLHGRIDVRPLDSATWRKIKAELPNLGRLRLPPGAALTLPGCWHGAKLLAVPGLPAPSSQLIRAEFVAGRSRTAL